MQVSVIVRQEKDGRYCAYAPELEGCAVYGDSEAAVLSQIGGAIHRHLAELNSKGQPEPQTSKDAFESFMRGVAPPMKSKDDPGK